MKVSMKVGNLGDRLEVNGGKKGVYRLVTL